MYKPRKVYLLRSNRIYAALSYDLILRSTVKTNTIELIGFFFLRSREIHLRYHPPPHRSPVNTPLILTHLFRETRICRNENIRRVPDIYTDTPIHLSRSSVKITISGNYRHCYLFMYIFSNSYSSDDLYSIPSFYPVTKSVDINIYNFFGFGRSTIMLFPCTLFDFS